GYPLRPADVLEPKGDGSPSQPMADGGPAYDVL
ncbi:MAG: hypothetical protein AVDCRST_MAG37-2259, partial [uncultured Rubrobacteraceae bacterium]